MVRASASAAARFCGIAGGIHFGVHPRRGVEIYDVAIVDGTQTRPVLYRAGLSELMTPYGDPDYVSWYPRDAGDYGMSLYSATRASAIVGADAPANATFAPAVFTDPKGRPVTIPRVVAIYERDGGVLWRHSARASRARQLVLSGYTHGRQLRLPVPLDLQPGRLPSTCRRS